MSGGPPGGAPICVSTPQTLKESEAAHVSSLVIAALSPGIALIFVGLRLLSRFLLETFGWDDALIVVAFILSVADAGATWKFSKIAHTGYHICDAPPMTLEGVYNLNKWLLIQQLLYNPILVFVKASVLLFLLRFQDVRWFIRYSLQGLFAINIMLGIAIFLADLFQCTPVRYMYDSIMMDIAAQMKAGADPATGMTPDGKLIKGGHCIKQTAFVTASASVTTLTEALTMLIPMAMIWSLKINRRKKIVVVSILSLGWIVVAVSIYRIVVMTRISDMSGRHGDVSYGAQNQISSIEVNLAIIVACAPALKALTKRLAPRFLSSARYNSKAYAYGYGGYGKQNSSMGGAGGTGRSRPGRSHKDTPKRHDSDDSDMITGLHGRHGTTQTIVTALRRSESPDGVRIGGRTESQEKIIRPDAIERTIEIDIEMDDLSVRHQKNGSGRKLHA